MVWNTITSKNRSHIPYQHLQWLIKYSSDYLNTSTGPSIAPLPEFTYYNLQWKSQASCKVTGAWNSKRSHFSLVSCLKGQISEQALLLESKKQGEIKAAAFQGIAGKSFFDGSYGTHLSTGAYMRRTETTELLTSVKAVELRAPHKVALLISLGAERSNTKDSPIIQDLKTAKSGPRATLAPSL